MPQDKAIFALQKITFNLSRNAGRQQEENNETSHWVKIKLNSLE